MWGVQSDFASPFCSLWINTVPGEWGGLYQLFTQQSGLPSVVFFVWFSSATKSDQLLMCRRLTQWLLSRTFSAVQIKCFCIETHSFSLTRLLQHYCVYWTMPSFFAWTFGLHYANISTSWPRNVGRVWMSRFRGAWQSLNFDKEYLFGFETLVFATAGILSMYNQLVTLQRERKTWNRII